MNEWISVKDKLPDEYGNYLGFSNGEVVEVTYCPVSKVNTHPWSTCDAEGFMLLIDGTKFEVTHWMPLPEPPKEVSE